ncbi:EAL domain-containing protein [Cupriavidus sp.]|uniref:EAL domain-containing protein n=1 Tax=Cupriavidus sp. TaxID=1873897 RepID=UPI0025C72F75|nr:EAL domain-containing protein [Cupriavidus sp.]MCA3184734.1 EAL domain-containing protein [Cupriavidus sp.]MCA3192072.1 EAL domain-containing protein [Cupriavidus sp.]MCA3197817.1 EAL domain-containing protein [Cupriavidus sp.]MCA3202869.1 EAL domain-containing protein [Cupriavidus sp.]MCA3206419.1 EAL domain-containing protein [Cupriavidus sp.]
MDPDTNDTPSPGVGGSGSPADAPFAAIQPVSFLAALEEHRAHFSPAHLLAVLVIRLDRFAHACESIGPQRAHALRAQVKSRVTAVASMPVAMQWLGPADLGVACVLADGAENAQTLSQAMAGELGRPFQVGGFEAFLSCSIGSAVDEHDTGTERLLQQAFDAMLQINRRGGAGIGTASRPATPRMATLLAALPSAIERGELSLQLQPRASLATSTITAYTVRLRWQHPVLGRVAPQDFLPAAEALGLMNVIGGWTLQQLLQLLRDTAPLGPLQFTLLATSSQLQADDTICMLRRAIDAHHVKPGQICVEVPVDIVPGSTEASDKARRLRGGGVGIALADFTDSAASQQALSLVQPDMVTLDARHLGHASQKPDTAASLRRACEWAKARGVTVCAKGVETQAQLDVVRGWGCDTMQGFLLAQPFPAPWLLQTHAAIAERARLLLKS